jgi:hypothetical protein
MSHRRISRDLIRRRKHERTKPRTTHACIKQT